jgi:hypothetical protein
MASNSGLHASMAAGSPAVTMKSCAAAALSGRPKTGAAMKRCPNFGVCLRENFRKPDADRAHRQMDRALREVCDDAIGRECNVRNRPIVGEHGGDHFTAAGIGNASGFARSQFEERTALFGAAVEHGDIVSGLHKVRRHGRAHTAESDESSFHAGISSW